ncbi:MAG: TonB-dependent receptor [Rhizomicrobium sp.]
MSLARSVNVLSKGNEMIVHGEIAVRHRPLSTLAAMLLLSVSPALAQSTGTQQIETVTVTAERTSANVQGLLSDEHIAKARSTISQDYVKTQATGQTIIQDLNLAPGVSFTNNDPYGSSGGDLRLRGFSGNKISLTLDGMPLNDTGNYAIFTNQLLDPEILDFATVDQGTTDVDSPTASASGGTINISTVKPTDEMGLAVKPTIGSFDFQRYNIIANSGQFGPWGTSAFIEGTYQHYDKFRGPGTLQKEQVNARIYQDLGSGDFMSIAGHFNSNRNAFYRSQSLVDSTTAGPFWKAFRKDNLATCTRDPATAGVADNDGATLTSATAILGVNTNGVSNLAPLSSDNTLNPSSCTNFFRLRINPSDTGNIRGSSLFTLTDWLKLTVDPSFQYVLANGGGTATISEKDPRLTAVSAGGHDLNGDGDTLDTVRVYAPSNTNTRRYGLLTSLVGKIDDDNAVQLAYSLDWGLHRQTGQNAFLNANNSPNSVFGGLVSDFVSFADGTNIRSRDRESKAILNQVSIDYEGNFLDDTLHVSAGIRAPFFVRDLDQRCFTAEGLKGVAATGGSGTGGAGGANVGAGQPYCTTQAPSGTVTFNGITYETFAGGTAKFDAPFKLEKKYNRILPNAGISYSPFGPEHQFYAAYAGTMSAPITDDLYNLGPAQLTTPGLNSNLQPETAQSYDLGYRYSNKTTLASLTFWHSVFANHIVSSFDQDLGFSVDRNVGGVLLNGVDAEVGFQPLDQLSLYGTVSYESTRLQQNLQTSAATIIATRGKELVETPNWTIGGRA